MGFGLWLLCDWQFARTFTDRTSCFHELNVSSSFIIILRILIRARAMKKNAKAAAPDANKELKKKDTNNPEVGSEGSVSGEGYRLRGFIIEE